MNGPKWRLRAVRSPVLGPIKPPGILGELVRNPCDVKTYEPGPADPWDEAYGRYTALLP